VNPTLSPKTLRHASTSFGRSSTSKSIRLFDQCLLGYEAIFSFINFDFIEETLAAFVRHKQVKGALSNQ
jgi:hypothetical protein